MPGPTDQLGVLPPQQGPFGQYLNPTRPMDQPMPAPTGWESKGVAVGTGILDFLKGIRQGRVAQFAEKEANTQSQVDAYHRHASQQLQREDLTNDTKQKIFELGNTTMAAHSQAEAESLPKEGVGGLIKNFLVQASGGAMKSRKPLDFQAASGEIAHIASAPEAKKDYWRNLANTQLAATIKPGMSEQDVQRQANQIANQLNLDGKLGAQDKHQWLADSAIGFHSAGSVPYLIDDLNRSVAPAAGAQGTPTTAPPPQAPPELNYSPVAGATPIRQPAAAVRPADSGAQATAPPPGAAAAPAGDAAATGRRPLTYDPVWGPTQFQKLQLMQKSGAAEISPVRSAITDDGIRKSVIHVNSGTGGGGFWDAYTQQRIAEPMTEVSTSIAPHVVKPVGKDRKAMYWDRDLGKNVPDLDETGRQYNIPENAVQIMAPDGSIHYEWKTKAVEKNDVAGSQGVQAMRDKAAAARQQRSIAAADRRQQVGIGASSGRQLTGIGARRVNERETLQRSYDFRAAALENGAVARMQSNALPGHPLTQEQVAAAKASVAPQVDVIETEREAALKRFDAGAPARTSSPSPRTAAPPPAPAQGQASAPAARRPKVGNSGLPDK